MSSPIVNGPRNYVRFLWRCALQAAAGDWRWLAWTGGLFLVCLLGLNAWCRQFTHGLIVTGMSDQVSWGVYIANFTFLVGVAAAAVMMVIPAYIYDNEELHDLVILGELLAVAAIIMCLAFVTVDLGRPDRFWHLIPGIGQFNFPASMLSWDVVVLNGYLLLNLWICGYLLYCRYRKQKPSKLFYIPFVFIAIGWAVSIHTVTAFLYVGLGGRPFWNSSIVGPRFIASAFTAGPALIILALQVIRRVTGAPIAREAAAGQGIDNRPPVAPARTATRRDFATLAAVLPELNSLAPEVWESLAAKSSIVLAQPGDILLRQGDTDDAAFFILSGRVVVKREEQGRLRITRSIGPGEQFGETSTLAKTPRAATAVAEDHCELLKVPGEVLLRMMESHALGKVIHARMHERLMITDRALMTLRGIVQVSMLINVFLLANEVFKEFYTGALHGVSSKYLFFGFEGHHALVPWIWTAVALNFIAMILLILPISRSLRWLNITCVMAIVGIWIEKGMGLVIPGFIPTPLGQMVEYTPSRDETLICFGIWAFGLLCYSVFLKMAVPILRGTISKANEPGSTAVQNHVVQAHS
jgi:Ni/Fe-hydrogenase subunit HybB-like protein